MTSAAGFPYQHTIQTPGDHFVGVYVTNATKAVVWLEGVARARAESFRYPDRLMLGHVLPDLQPGQVVGLECDGYPARFHVRPLPHRPVHP